jgi:hypothetical protein
MTGKKQFSGDRRKAVNQSIKGLLKNLKMGLLTSPQSGF